MNVLALLTAIATLVAAAPTASTPTPKAAVAAAEPKVRQLRVRLAKVLEHAAGLPAALTEEAHHVDKDAARALQGVNDEAALEKVLAEFAAFSAHLTGRSDTLTSEAASDLPAGALEKAQKMLPGLEGRVQKVLAHMKADKGSQSPEHASTIAAMDQALAAVPGQNAFQRAVALHKSLITAHDFLATRTQELAADRARLTCEIEAQQAKILFMMLRQRRKLPMKAQVALLKRHQFKDFSYAQRLLKSHSSSQPLDTQLLAMLPEAVAQKLAGKVPGGAGSLAAAGSDGRVQIVSSRMKNSVQVMAAELGKAKVQLQAMANSASTTATEKRQANEIVKGLESVLKKVSSTHDLKSQMDAMTEMQTKLQTWMVNFASQK